MASNKTLSSLGEFGFISRIAATACSGTGVVTGIGDDAAVTALTPGMQLLTSTDMLLENVHFRRSWHDPYLLGRKSLAVSISDIAAMGGISRWCLLSLAVPKDIPLDFLDNFTRGFLAMAAEQNVSLIGGDTCSSASGLIISVTIMGEQLPDRIIRRSGAVPGDDIWVTGNLGDAALGLKLLEEGLLQGREQQDDNARQLISRLLDPAPRSGIGQLLAQSGLVSSMIDISDGLLADFGHIAELSGAGGEIHLAALPVSAAFRAHVASSAQFPHHLVLSGGEDYELAFTASPANREKIASLMKNSGIEATPVGIVSSLPGVKVLDTDGNAYTPPTPGFNHF